MHRSEAFSGLLSNRTSPGANHRKQGDKVGDTMIELTCEMGLTYDVATLSTKKCGQPATYTFRFMGKVYHFCSRHYEHAKMLKEGE